MTAPRPTATGTLCHTPLLHVLVSLLERRATGTLVLETTDHKRSALQVERGTPVKIRASLPELRLAQVLVAAGWLEAAMAEETFREGVRQRRLHGEALVEQGVLPREVVERALRSQLVRKLGWAANLPGDTLFGFYDKADLLANQPGAPTPVAPLVVLWQLAKSHATAETIDSVVARLERMMLRLHPQAQPERFGLDASEQAVVDVLRARPQALSSLQQLALLSESHLSRLAYVLTITRHLEFGKPDAPLGLGFSRGSEEELLLPKPPSPATHPLAMGTRTVASPLHQPLPTCTGEVSGKAPPPTPPTPVHSAQGRMLGRPAQNEITQPLPTPATTTGGFDASSRRADLEDLAKRMDGLDHYGILGVGRDAPAPAVQAAYFQLAKLYHPDRLSGALSDMRPIATTVFARITEAYQVLSDSARRTEYDRAATGGTETDEEEAVQRVLRAAGAFQKAEILVKKRMWPAAELEVNRAIEDDPTQADYIALRAWILASKPDGDHRLADAVRLLDDAIARNPQSEKNRFYRVQILRRLGRMDDAIVDCRYIVEHNPYHVDAQREIRLFEMRRAAAPVPVPTKPTTPGAHRKPGSESVDRQSRHSRPEPPSPPPTGLLGRLFKR